MIMDKSILKLEV